MDSIINPMGFRGDTFNYVPMIHQMSEIVQNGSKVNDILNDLYRIEFSYPNSKCSDLSKWSKSVERLYSKISFTNMVWRHDEASIF